MSWPAAAALAIALGAPAAVTPAPARVASLNLAADEVLVEILPPERLVSVTKWADAPETSNIVGRVPPSVFRFEKADMERLVALRPDLVVVSEYTDADFLDLVRRSGMRVHRMQGLSSVAGIRQAILDLGRAVGAEDAAARLVSRYDATLADLAKRLAGAPRKRLLYWSSGMTAGEGTAIGSLIECAGAINVGRELRVQGIAPVGAERAFLAQPDAILVGTWPLAEESIKEHPLLSKLEAVRRGRIVSVPTELLVALSQHAADGCWYLAHELHPDRVPRAKP
jgi:iron complex transport system substrate-binding protein